MNYLAVDLGAESGRVLCGTLSDGKLELKELHRFPNQFKVRRASRYFDVEGLLREVKRGLGRAGKSGLKFRSLSVDTWGVTPVFFSSRKLKLADPHHYRDSRTEAPFKQAISSPGKAAIYAETGIQFLSLNTLYQFMADKVEQPMLFKKGHRFLILADYLNYRLSGVVAQEESLASTSQLYDPRKRAWSARLMKNFGFPAAVFPKIVKAPYTLGPLDASLAKQITLPGVKVVATCGHDTAAAIAAVPARGRHWAYLSSGTWSLLGVELTKPLMTRKAMELGFTNEVGLNRSIRFLKNIAGLFVLQECRKDWSRAAHAPDYARLVTLAENTQPLLSLIDLQDPRFGVAGSMVAKVQDYCRATGQKVPRSKGAVVRCVLDSLALEYRCTFDDLAHLTGRRPRQLHIVGGGSRNGLLNQSTANALGIPVYAGPVEATAIGNIGVQAMADGAVKDLTSLRAIVRRSFEMETYLPIHQRPWQLANIRYQKLKRHKLLKP